MTTKIDVSTASSAANGVLQTSAIGGGFIAAYTALQPTGTGVIQPFLRIKAKDSESGFNTDAKAQTILDNHPGQNWTHSILVSDFRTVQINSVAYLQFLLDANQANGNANISLNQVQIFLSDVDPLTNFTLSDASVVTKKGQIKSGTEAILKLTDAVTGAREVFRLNDPILSSSSKEIIVAGGHGSGSGDLFFYVKASIFAGASPSTYVTFFSQLGSTPGQYKSSGGFEEWSFLDDPRPAPSVIASPEPGSLLVFGGLGLLMSMGRYRSRRRARTST